MDKLIVAFCGNKYVFDDNLKLVLKKEIIKLISDNTFLSFYCGGYGAFDSLVNSTIDEIRKEQTLNCEKIFVTPYLNVDSEYYNKHYDHIIYPPLETVPKKYCILRRNDWIADNADVVISYVITHGGAEKMLMRAKRRNYKTGKPHIINLNEIK